MFGLPKAVEIHNPLPKKAIFDKFKPSAADRRLFDDQIHRLSIVAEISPQTVNIPADPDVAAIYVIAVRMKTVECSRKNIELLAKLIDQKMLFALQYEDTVRFAAYRANRVILSDGRPIADWRLELKGRNLRGTWDALVAYIGEIQPVDGTDLDEVIIQNEHREKLKKQISALERRAMSERQPRRKWDLAEEIRRLKQELEGV